MVDLAKQAANEWKAAGYWGAGIYTDVGVRHRAKWIASYDEEFLTRIARGEEITPRDRAEFMLRDVLYKQAPKAWGGRPAEPDRLEAQIDAYGGRLGELTDMIERHRADETLAMPGATIINYGQYGALQYAVSRLTPLNPASVFGYARAVIDLLPQH